MLFEPQHAFDGLVHLAKGLFDSQFLVPILQQIGKVARGQLQAIIQGNKGDGLTLPCTIGHTREVDALIVFGLGRGFYDGNVMPVLSQVARPDLRATGYGVLNLCGCLAGGGVALLAGALKEAVGLGRAFQLTGLLLLAATFLLRRIRMPDRREGGRR